MKNFKSLLTLIMIICVIMTVCSCVKQHEHNISTEWSSDATYHWHACNGEGCNEKADYTSHTYGDGELTTPATEEAEGLMTYKCISCGYEKTETIEKLAPSHKHSLTRKDEIAPTCKTPGIAEYYFCICGVKFLDAEGTEPIDSLIILEPTGHTEEPFGEARESTCSTNGLSQGIRCTVCLEVIKEPEILELVDHKISNYENNNNATCYSDGTETGRCDGCGLVDERVIEGSKLPHIYAEKIVDDAHLKSEAKICTEFNIYWYDCQFCNSNAKDNADAQDKFYAGDIIGEHKISESWTSEDGYHFHKCENEGCTYADEKTNCTDILTDSDHNCDTCGANDVSDHAYGDWENLDDNNHKHTCNCGYIEVVAHEWDDGVISVSPTHFEEGERVKSCTAKGCDATKTEKVAVLTEHTYDQMNTELEGAVAKPATCDEATSYYYSCICGAMGEETFVFGDALGHDIVKDEAKAPTCTTTGLSEGEHCTRCDYKVPQTETEKAPHAWTAGDVVIDNKEGTITYRCRNCNEMVTEQGTLPMAPDHVCDHLVSGVETEFGKWTSCSICGLKSYAVTALSAYKGNGVTHASADVYLPKEGGKPTVSDDMVKQSVTVSDVAVSYNLVAGSDSGKAYLEFTYTFTAENDMRVYVMVNGRSTNTSGSLNSAAEAIKFLKVFHGDTEIPVNENAAFPAYVEGRNYWEEQSVATIDLVKGENTVTFRFTKDEKWNSSKAYGIYASYFRFVEIPENRSCENGYHSLVFNDVVTATCNQAGMKAHYLCELCGECFDLESNLSVKKEYLVIPAFENHVFENVPRLQEDGSYAFKCTRGCGTTKAHTCTGEGGYLIIARQPNQVWYEDAQTFNPDRMEIYFSTSCEYGCSNSTVVAGHIKGYDALTYTYQNGDSFKAGDEYITINYVLDGKTYSAKLPVTVTAAGKTITVDNTDAGFSYTEHKSNLNNKTIDPSRQNDTGRVGQSAFGGSYANNFANGDVARFTFTLDESGKANIVLRAASENMMGAGGTPPCAHALSVNDLMIIRVDGKEIILDDSVILNGSVNNLEKTANRWVWTNWTNIDLGSFDLSAGEHTVEITFHNVLPTSANAADTPGYKSAGQLDCLNVFLG